MQYLEEKFDGNVLALGADLHRRRGHSWAPRSPDLSVQDFSLWPIMKRLVYLPPRPTTLEGLKDPVHAHKP